MSIAQALQGTVAALQVGQEIYQYAVNMMDEAEKSKQSGVGKFDTVYKLVRDFVLELGKNWDKWEQYIVNFIHAAKSIYNAVKGIL